MRLIESAQPGLAPNAQMVEQQPGWVLASHFHREYQFQIFTAGSGTIGAHAIEPLTVHYTSPESGYGPIVAGPHGLSYYTLRPTAPAGACYLPESRESMRRGLRKRHAMAHLRATSPMPPMGSESVRITECIAPDDEGMASWKLSAAPGAACPASRLSPVHARYYYVISGAMDVGNEALESGSVVFVHDEPDFQLRACGAGLEVLALQFPSVATSP